jgi:hypothetical protein
MTMGTKQTFGVYVRVSSMDLFHSMLPLMCLGHGTHYGARVAFPENTGQHSPKG